MTPKRRNNAEADGFDLFPPEWPCSAWHGFQQDLLAAVYERSDTLWPALREACDDLTRTIEHQEYEGDIVADRPFREAIPAIWSWREALPVLRQARSLVGNAQWHLLLYPPEGAAALSVKGRSRRTSG